MHVSQQTGSDCLRKTTFARRRIERIERILGGDEVKKANVEVYGEFLKKHYKEIWNVFENGTAEEQAALEEELWRGTGHGIKGEPK